MRIIKRTILKEDLISRVSGPFYGVVTASTIDLPIFIEQTYDNIGLFTDVGFSATTNTFPAPTDPTNIRLRGVDVSHYYNYGGSISGYSGSRLTECQNYGITMYVPGFNVDTNLYHNHLNQVISGKTCVFEYTPLSIARYTINGDENDPHYGTQQQRSGTYFEDYLDGQTRKVVINGNTSIIPTTKYYQFNEGFNKTNSSLSAITKLDQFFGVVFPPEIQSDVFILRGKGKILERHLKLSEVETVNHFSSFGNGYYNIIEQKL